MGYCHEHEDCLKSEPMACACWQEFAGHSPMFAAVLNGGYTTVLTTQLVEVVDGLGFAVSDPHVAVDLVVMGQLRMLGGMHLDPPHQGAPHPWLQRRAVVNLLESAPELVQVQIRLRAAWDRTSGAVGIAFFTGDELARRLKSAAGA